MARRILLALALVVGLAVEVSAQLAIQVPVCIQPNASSLSTVGGRYCAGTGSPSGVLTGWVGDVYTDRSSGTVYAKTSGAGTTSGWVAVATGGGGAGSFSTLDVGTGTGFTSPTRIVDVNDALSGTLGATNYAAAKFTLSLAPSAAPSGQARAFYMSVGQSGTQNHTGEISAALFDNSSSTSGTLTEENGGLFAVQRSVGTSTLSQGIRIDRNYSSSAVVTSSRGININAPSLTGGATIGTNIGLLIGDQSGATTSANFVSNTASSGTLTHYSDGSLLHSLTSSAAFTSGAQARKLQTTTTQGGTPGWQFALDSLWDYNPSTNVTDASARIGIRGSVMSAGSHAVGQIIGGYFVAGNTATETFDAWSATDGGGIQALTADAAVYGTSGTVGQAMGVTAWGGTGTGSTTTNLYRFYVPGLYDYSGTVTNHVGLQIDDQVTGASGITNNWAIRYLAPSSKTFGVKGNGDLTLGGATMTFPGSNASGCLSNNGSGTLSWAACSSTGSGYATVQDEGSGLTARSILNFTGAGVSCVDNSGATRTDCTISGGGTVTNTGTLTSGQLIKGNGSADVTVGNLTGDVTTSGSMATTIANSAVTLAKIANASASSKLLGSGASGSGSAYSELTLGTNLSMSGTTLNASSSGKVVQVVNTQTGAVATGTTTIPIDDTIPQNTEGDEYMTLSITPTSSSNKLKIEVVFDYSCAAAYWAVAALFQDSTANALAAGIQYQNTGTGMSTMSFTHYMTAGTTSSTTFKVRAGPGDLTPGTMTFNGVSGARKLGGVIASSITISEIVP